MSPANLPVGSYVRLEKRELQGLIDQLKSIGYRVVGPRESDAAIVYDDLDSIDQLPIGVCDQQDGGVYRLSQTDSDAYFDYVVGPHSLKRFLFPAREQISEATRRDGTWEFQAIDTPAEKIAVVGPRACDLEALAIQDRVFLEGPYVDPGYQLRRESLFVVAVNCRRHVSTCFCHSMKTGPAVRSGFDLALTEMDSFFVIQIGSEIGAPVVAATAWTPCSVEEIERAQAVSESVETAMQESSSNRCLDTAGIRELLLDNLEHPRWQTVGERCLSCGNCTMVCPTCFCSSIEEVADLGGDHIQRERTWTSCFTADHSYMHSGTVRKSVRSRYRQWLTHKLATWHDQFDTSGCTGCGRCITWCPVGIDLTEEVAAIRGD